MKYVLVLFYASRLATTIGPFDDYDSCRIVKELAKKDHWQGYCYPIGKVFIEKETEEQ